MTIVIITKNYHKHSPAATSKPRPQPLNPTTKKVASVTYMLSNDVGAQNPSVKGTFPLNTLRKKLMAHPKVDVVRSNTATAHLERAQNLRERSATPRPKSRGVSAEEEFSSPNQSVSESSQPRLSRRHVSALDLEATAREAELPPLNNSLDDFSFDD